MASGRNEILGKRGRRVVGSELAEAEYVVMPKRSRARRAEVIDKDDKHETAAASFTKTRGGLLTPEPSTSTVSQNPPSSSDNKDSLPPSQIFAFMRLPTELRLHIYYMALVRHEPINLHAERAPSLTDEDSSPTEPSSSKAQLDTTVIPNLPSDPPNNPHPEQRIQLRPLPSPSAAPPPPPHPIDPVVPVILRLNKQIYKEARQLLYSENVFTLSLSSGIYTLSTLHQRSRSLIKHVVLEIPSHHDILDGFADLVRLGLRYCWGLKTFRIILLAGLPDDTRANGATSVYANAFHILRWLPRGCSVVLEGCVSETVRRVVLEEGRLMSVLDERSYLKRQHQMPERH